MARESDLVYRITVPSLISMVCCVVLGFAWNVLNPHHSIFGFIVYGFVGSVFFFMLRSGRSRDAFAMFLIAWLCHAVFLSGGVRDIAWYVVDLLFFSIVPSAVYLFFSEFHQRRRWVGASSPVTLGLLVAGVTVPVAIIIGYIQWPGVNQWRLNILMSQLGLVTKWFFIGAGLGVGIALSEFRPVSDLLRKSEG